MQVFSKFKQLFNDIKLIIIGALLMSCIAVYGVGTCIVSATADDVAYDETTVKNALDELYDLASDYCPPEQTCYKSINNRMKENSILDDRASTYVTSPTGINFSQVSSDTNGKGLYERATTKDDPNPIFYYRGDVNNNNIIFGHYCWKILHTTDTGGIKIIYNGNMDENGLCTVSQGNNTIIGNTHFNNSVSIPSHIGYMYNKEYMSRGRQMTGDNTQYKYGKGVSYSNGSYNLTDVITGTGNWSSDRNSLNNHHYTCFTTGTTCTNVQYIIKTDADTSYYMILEDGQEIEDLLNDMFNDSDVNMNSSLPKEMIDNWYIANLSSYTSYIEDTVYCNDRSISDLGGWNPNGGDTSKSLYYSPRQRTFIDYSPSLECTRNLDSFTVSSSKGNGALTYPVGLITSDEVMLAGGKGDTPNTSYFLNTDRAYWTMSPRNTNTVVSGLFGVKEDGQLYYNNINEASDGNGDSLGVRPVISLSPTVKIANEGDGTATNPYMVITN